MLDWIRFLLKFTVTRVKVAKGPYKGATVWAIHLRDGMIVVSIYNLDSRVFMEMFDCSLGQKLPAPESPQWTEVEA